jgi:hypothetical protein
MALWTVHKYEGEEQIYRAGCRGTFGRTATDRDAKRSTACLIVLVGSAESRPLEDVDDDRRLVVDVVRH